LEHCNEWQGEITQRRQNGSELVVEINATLVRDASGKLNSVLSIVTDITRRKAAEREVTNLAYYDRVTGLPNRHALMKRLDQLLDSGTKNGAQGALLWIDLGRLKSLNDTRGHDMGDRLLQQTGERIIATLNSDDLAARFGGDEFVVLMGNLNGNPNSAISKAERLLQRLSKPFNLGGYIHSGSTSIGLTFFRCGQDMAAEILKRADIAMYEAKSAGRNSLRLFDAQMQNQVDLRAALEDALRQALQNDELRLEYQPQVADTGETRGVEALLRWEHPTRGPISPTEFIPLAEATGLIIPYGEWVLEQACNQLKRWESNPLARSLSISVNVSAQQIRHHRYVDRVTEILCRTGANSQKLKLELTESTLVTDIDATVEKMTKLKSVGIKFSLDDFGTGFSSLSYLKRLPLDQLKIDRSFVSDVITDPNAAAIANTVITLGQSLGLEVIAEGVETESQRHFLATHGCKIYQGYLISRPMRIDNLEAYLLGSKGNMQEVDRLERSI
jgi:diguanylate cyclase (GGDEF)-like protein